MKKVLFAIIAFAIMVASFNLVNFKADSVSDSTGTSTLTINNVEKEVVYGVDHQIVKATTTTKGANYGQFINAFAMKTDGFSSKLVNWAVQKDSSSYVRKNIIQAAKDYEAKNPGWIVVSGINADQYFFKFGTDLGLDGSAIMEPSPYYPMVSNGDKLFTVSATGNATSVIGFTNDGSVNSFVSSEGAGGYVLSVIDENNTVLKTFPVEALNKNASANGTSVWCFHFSKRLSQVAEDQPVSTTNKLFIVENAETAFMSMYQNGDDEYYPGHYNTNTIFAKGYISNDTLTSYTLTKGQFAVETSNPEVISALSNGKRIKVEQYFANEAMNKVEEAIGYHSCHRVNGIDNSTTASYDTNHYSRALFGRKADGTYVLLTADYVTSLGSFGMTWTECNALAEYYGVQDMYQMDGGGSVTAMVRNSDGSFKVTNFPKDSGKPELPRENFSYLFFVIRDPGVQCLDSNITYHSVKLTKASVAGNATISNIKVGLLGKEYDFNDSELVLDGLDEKTEYELNIKYDITINGQTKKSSFNKTFKTGAYVFPTETVELKSVSKTSATFVKCNTDYAENISNIVIHLGDQTFNMGSAAEYTATDLLYDQEYPYYFTYDIYDPVSKKTFSGSTEELILHTTDYELPTISNFSESSKTDNSVTISYKYSDPDRVVEKAYISLNGAEYQVLTARTGSVDVTGLDFTKNSYDIKLVLVFKGTKLESSVLHYEMQKAPETPDTPAPAPEKTKKCGKKNAELIVGLLTASTLLAFVIRRKK